MEPRRQGSGRTLRKGGVLLVLQAFSIGWGALARSPGRSVVFQRVLWPRWWITPVESRVSDDGASVMLWDNWRGGVVRRAVRAVWAGYRATWMLLRRSARRPFGEASGSHREWLFPQFVVALGIALLIGVATPGSPGDWLVLLVGVVFAILGLALTAAVGRAAGRGSFGED